MNQSIRACASNLYSSRPTIGTSPRCSWRVTTASETMDFLWDKLKYSKTNQHFVDAIKT